MPSSIPTSFIGDDLICSNGSDLYKFCCSATSKSLSKHAGSPKLLVSFTNFGYIDMAINFVAALRKLDILNVIVFALDEASYLKLNALGISTWLLSTRETPVYTESSSNFGSVEFNSICNVKPWIVLQCLKGGFDVVWTDTDVIWLRVRFFVFFLLF